tara:strand:- start:522 stop:857 length:336 start_codon:yes stop_codon:yes gene_type:complete
VKIDDNIKKDLEQRKKEYVLEFIRKKDLISSDGNVILSQKIFIVNSVLKWCIDAVANKKMSQTKWGKFNKVINQYIAGIVDLKWKDGTLEIIEIPHDNEKRRSTRTRNKPK